MSTAGPPRWSQKKDNIRLVVKPAASTVVLKCPAEGEPAPTIEWLKNSLPFDHRTIGSVGVSRNVHHHVELPVMSPTFFYKYLKVNSSDFIMLWINIRMGCIYLFQTVSFLQQESHMSSAVL